MCLSKICHFVHIIIHNNILFHRKVARLALWITVHLHGLFLLVTPYKIVFRVRFVGVHCLLLIQSVLSRGQET